MGEGDADRFTAPLAGRDLLDRHLRHVRVPLLGHGERSPQERTFETRRGQMTESHELEAALEQTDDVTSEERLRWEMENHIDTLRAELHSAKSREINLLIKYHGLVDRLAERKGRRW